MLRQDHGRLVGVPAIGVVLDWLVRPHTFGRLSFRKGCAWTPCSLAKAVFIWAWGQEAALTDRYATARQTIAQLPNGQQESVSYQAFMKLLTRHSAVLLFAIISALQRRMRELFIESYRVAGYVAFGVDGTRIDVPRTLANEQAFGKTICRTRRRGRRRRADHKKAAAPRIWLTTLWHLGTSLPWSWTRGASDSSERAHLLGMLDWLPERSLLTADAGFVGYHFWQSLRDAGHDFLIRIGANVTLLKELGYFRECGDRVYLWPDKQARKRRQPIVLRLVVAHNGKHPVYLVTTVLAKSSLSDAQLIELYKARWGIEVFYRSFKRTFERHKLRSHSPYHALVELDWSLLALWAACLYAKHQQAEAGRGIATTSVAGVLRILRRALCEPSLPIALQLATALVDSYDRHNKASRDYPRKKTDTPATSPPTIRKATKPQAALAKKLRRLTA